LIHLFILLGRRLQTGKY